ncbi:MAG: (2Fe-2S)-binding protein [Rhodospirillales bacterium]|nr:(2Fe-2S)-binding protein [Rhodospirillales bacterium]
MMVLMINGKSISVPYHLYNVSLLDFIRDTAKLKGTKFGCGKGLCGACTVHVDGDAVRSCQETVRDIIGHNVTTIEGLSGMVPGAQLHPVQEAWIEISVPQCGYCQPGQIMTATAFLENNPNPSDEEIREVMDGNLCRCGTYPRIHRAIRHAAMGDHYADR